jgi:hypothetical protein
MYQKFVVKKPSLKQSVIRLPSSMRSGVARHLTSSRRSRSENPIEPASMIFPSVSTRREASSQPKASWASKVSCVTDFVGSSMEGIEDSRSYVQRNCASNIRPPRMV